MASVEPFVMNVQTLKEWILMALCVTEWASVRPGPQSKPAHRDFDLQPKPVVLMASVEPCFVGVQTLKE